MKTVKFRTKSFGLLPEGTIVDVYCLAENNSETIALLWVPPARKGKYDGCGCLMLGIKDEKELEYHDFDTESYINLEYAGNYEKDFKQFLLKTRGKIPQPPKVNKPVKKKVIKKKTASKKVNKKPIEHLDELYKALRHIIVKGYSAQW